MNTTNVLERGVDGTPTAVEVEIELVKVTGVSIAREGRGAVGGEIVCPFALRGLMVADGGEDVRISGTGYGEFRPLGEGDELIDWEIPRAAEAFIAGEVRVSIDAVRGADGSMVVVARMGSAISFHSSDIAGDIDVPVDGLRLRPLADSTSSCRQGYLCHSGTVTIRPVWFEEEAKAADFQKLWQQQVSACGSVWGFCRLRVSVTARPALLDPKAFQKDIDFDGLKRLVFNSSVLALTVKKKIDVVVVGGPLPNENGTFLRRAKGSKRAIFVSLSEKALSGRRSDCFVLSHELGHFLKGNHPGRAGHGEWEGGADTVLEALGNGKRSRNTMKNCFYAGNTEEFKTGSEFCSERGLQISVSDCGVAA